MRSALAPAVLLWLSASSLAAPAEPTSSRSRTVGGVRIETRAEEDGGRLVRLSRRRDGYRFEYHLGFWRGNGGVYVGAAFRRGRCRSGDADMLAPLDVALARSRLDQWLGAYLRECPLSRAREDELRRALAAGWPLFDAWAREAAAVTEQEAEAILRYGADED